MAPAWAACCFAFGRFDETYDTGDDVFVRFLLLMKVGM